MPTIEYIVNKKKVPGVTTILSRFKLSTPLIIWANRLGLEGKDYFKELKIVKPEKNAEQFYNFYESNNWYRGKTRIVKWKNCVKTWKFDKETDEEGTTFEEKLEARRALRKGLT